MRALVTGAAGFIGSHTAEKLLARGHRVVGVDNFDPFYARTLKEQNLAGLRDQSAFEMVEADIRDADALARLSGPFDVVVHLAARAGVRPSIQDPVGYADTNIQGTMNLLELCAKQDPQPKLVFASSSSVYGNNDRVPFSETDPVDQPISPYAATKRSAELLCHTTHHLHGLPVFCLRLFTVYGPRQRPDLAIQKFARKILAGEPIDKYGAGNTSRDYTFVDDITDGIARAVDRCTGFEIINLGSNSPISLAQMIETVAAACGREPVVRELPPQPGDVQRTFANVDEAHRLLDWAPSTPFAEGVRRQVEWLRQHPA